MKLFRVVTCLLLILVLVVGCSHDGNRTADKHVPQNYIDVETTIDLPEIPTSDEAISAPSSPIIIDEDSDSVRLLWFNIEGELLHEYDVSDTTLLEAIPTADTKNSLLIHGILSKDLKLINLNTREIVEVNTPMIPDSSHFFYNDYGAQLLFAGWLDDPIEVVIFGNKTVYTYNQLGEYENIFEASKPIYGSALSPNKQLLALLIASDDFVGAEADLIVINLQGQVVYEQERLSYIGHSDGFNFLYPMEWTNEHTVAIPQIHNGSLPFFRGYSLVNINDNTVEHNSEPTLSEETFNLLKSKFDSLHPMNVLKVITQSSSEDERYIAIFTSTITHQVWLMDLVEQKVTLISQGLLIGWNEQDELIILQYSSPSPYIIPYYVKLNLNEQYGEF